MADAGYRNAAQQAQAHANGHVVLTPEHGREADNGELFHKSRFHYDAASDTDICPRGEFLLYARTTPHRGNREAARVYQCGCYKTCPVRSQCSKSRSGRTIVHHPQHTFQRYPKALREQQEMKALLAKRKAIIEPLFGCIKENEGFRRWSARGLANASAQRSMLCLAVNLKKIYTWWKRTTTPKRTMKAPSCAA